MGEPRMMLNKLQLFLGGGSFLDDANGPGFRINNAHAVLTLVRVWVFLASIVSDWISARCPGYLWWWRGIQNGVVPEGGGTRVCPAKLAARTPHPAFYTNHRAHSTGCSRFRRSPSTNPAHRHVRICRRSKPQSCMHRTVRACDTPSPSNIDSSSIQ